VILAVSAVDGLAGPYTAAFRAGAGAIGGSLYWEFNEEKIWEIHGYNKIVSN
jgi:hypothetical protein